MVAKKKSATAVRKAATRKPKSSVVKTIKTKPKSPPKKTVNKAVVKKPTALKQPNPRGAKKRLKTIQDLTEVKKRVISKKKKDPDTLKKRKKASLYRKKNKGKLKIQAKKREIKRTAADKTFQKKHAEFVKEHKAVVSGNTTDKGLKKKGAAAHKALVKAHKLKIADVTDAHEKAQKALDAQHKQALNKAKATGKPKKILNAQAKKIAEKQIVKQAHDDTKKMHEDRKKSIGNSIRKKLASIFNKGKVGAKKLVSKLKSKPKSHLVDDSAQNVMGMIKSERANKAPAKKIGAKKSAVKKLATKKPATKSTVKKPTIKKPTTKKAKK